MITQYGGWVTRNGRQGGQELVGGVGAGDNLVLRRTNNTTRGSIRFDRFGRFDGNGNLRLTTGYINAPAYYLNGAAIVRGQLPRLQFSRTVEWAVNTIPTAQLILTGDCTLDNPTDQTAGLSYALMVVQDDNGNHVLSFGRSYWWASGTAPTITTAANAVDILFFFSDGSHMYGSILQNFRAPT